MLRTTDDWRDERSIVALFVPLSYGHAIRRLFARDFGRTEDDLGNLWNSTSVPRSLIYIYKEGEY